MRRLGVEPREFELLRPVQGAEFAERIMAVRKGKAPQMTQKAERASLGRSVPCAQARAGEAAVAVVE